MGNYYDESTICAQASGSGAGAVTVLRLSGPRSIEILDQVFTPAGKKPLRESENYKMRFGVIRRGEEVIDEVMAVVFRAPHSYTGEESAEIYCHGSEYIAQEILKLLMEKGARLAEGGEFTKRAFLNGKLDLAQAEAVADLIASQTKAAHDVAMAQMKGGFSQELSKMRGDLVEIVSLMELELDFSEEDVEFADRVRLKELLEAVCAHLDKLIESFALGNVIKNGVPVAIVGATNTGKSTLLNALLGEEKAIVSDIAGTTRDVIEDTININGVTFRFIDTAGIRNTTETIEMIGIERTWWKMAQASVVMLMLDSQRPETFEQNIANLSERVSAAVAENGIEKQVVVLLNKADLVSDGERDLYLSQIAEYGRKYDLSPARIFPISAKVRLGVDEVVNYLALSRKSMKTDRNSTLVTNLRHLEALRSAREALTRVWDGLSDSIPTDLVAQDIREAIYHIGTITGEVSTDEVLGVIFGRFCIGK
ncbi:MAG: tRNA uridine-5-carboxymethylaminomethyl(34) synthesis GTPase MnmE [Bacteroidales bacterium]|nr:tRNA uridine-5-carboxymethylaminomethyl(34) synthesis GTPase MnmE [Bacteroidales bacterium]